MNTAQDGMHPTMLPGAVFLDTSIFVGQNYNFGSVALTAFVTAIRERQIQLLLPAPTQTEIEKHLDQRVADALKSLEDVRRKTPFLNDWATMPNRLSAFSVYEGTNLAKTKLNNFLRSCDCVPLGYDGVKVEEIMDWYTEILPPFATGKKRKEFPDAFALAILIVYSRSHGVSIAVVSEDNDFKAACARYPSLLFFDSTNKLTEILLIDQVKIEQMRGAILDDVSLLEANILEEAKSRDYRHWAWNLEIKDVNHYDVEIDDLNIIALGSHECVVSFQSTVKTEFLLQWEDGHEDERVVLEEWKADTVVINGVAKVRLDPANHAITEVSSFEVDHISTHIDVTPEYFRPSYRL